VRGTVLAKNGLRSVHVKTGSPSVRAAHTISTDDGFATWRATVPLAAGQNTLTVEVRDAAGSVVADAAQANIFSGTDAPAAAGPQIEFAGAIALDSANNRAFVPGRTDNSSARILVAVDLTTGARTVFSEASAAAGLDFSLINDMSVDTPRNRALVLDPQAKAVIAVNLATGARTIMSNPDRSLETCRD
jgi:hypothetical protein